jgi:ABC-type multidrug transport system fused ATPase/permease subunit
MLYSLAIESVSLGLTTDYAGVVRNFGTTIILTTIHVSILLFVDVIFPLFVTIIEVFRICSGNCQKRKKSLGLEE